MWAPTTERRFVLPPNGSGAHHGKFKGFVGRCLPGERLGDRSMDPLTTESLKIIAGEPTVAAMEAEDCEPSFGYEVSTTTCWCR